MVLSPPLACSQYFSPRFLQPHKILLCQPPSAPSLCSLPRSAHVEREALLLVHKSAEGTAPLYCTSRPQTSSTLSYDCTLSSPFPAATWSLLHFQLFSLLALQHCSDLPIPVRTAEVPLALLEQGWKFFSLRNTSRSPQPQPESYLSLLCLSHLLAFKNVSFHPSSSVIALI